MGKAEGQGEQCSRLNWVLSVYLVYQHFLKDSIHSNNLFYMNFSIM